MAINYGANLTGVDLDRYNEDKKFLSQDRFLQGTGLDKPAITFNPSRSNTGIMSQYPGGKLLKYPIIPQYGGDGDGGGPFGPKDLGEITADNYGKGVTDPTGMGYELTEEDMKNIQQQKNVNALRAIGKFGLYSISPFSPMTTYGIGKGIDKVKDIFSGGGNDGGGGVPDNVTAAGGSYTGGYHAAEGGFENTSSDGNTSTNNSQEDQGEVTAADGGRIGYKDGYSVQDDMTDYATNVGKEASPGGGFKDSGGDGGGSPPPSYSNNESPNRFQEMEKINPAFDYGGKFGRLGGLLDLTKTIEEEEPVGNIGYLDPSGNFGIGYDTNLGTVGNANLGNFNLNHTGTGGTNLSYTDGFANNDGFYGVNFGTNTGPVLGASYAKDGLGLNASYAKDGLGLNLRFEKKFNNGGIVGMYR